MQYRLRPWCGGGGINPRQVVAGATAAGNRMYIVKVNLTSTVGHRQTTTSGGLRGRQGIRNFTAVEM